MSLTVTVLGSSGSYAGPNNACSGYLVRCSTPVPTSVWVDCGPGTLSALQRYIDLEDLDAVVVSHVHPDHFAELPVFANAVRWFLERESVQVATTAAVADHTQQLASVAAEVFDIQVMVDGSTFGVGGLGFSFVRTDHPVETLAMRIEGDGAAVGYTSDTGPDWHPSALGQGLDLLISESSMHGSDPSSGAKHLRSTEAGRLASEAGAKRLAITHVPPNCDPAAHQREAAEGFGGPVEYCAPGTVLTV
ncbi:MAG: MBL fold metallo-hydrolase [Acidimicrobiales bacterium]